MSFCRAAALRDEPNILTDFQSHYTVFAGLDEGRFIREKAAVMASYDGHDACFHPFVHLGQRAEPPPERRDIISCARANTAPATSQKA